MHAGLFDVLHHSTDQHLSGVVADRVDINLGGVLEEPVDQHWAFGRQASLAAEGPEPGQFAHGASQMFSVVHDLHRPATEHVARSHEHGKADSFDDAEGLFEIGSGATRGLRNAQLVAQRAPFLAVLG